MDSYKQLNKVNSQICEQRKLAKSIAHMKFENYMKTLTLFFAYTNLKAKGVLPTPFQNEFILYTLIVIPEIQIIEHEYLFSEIDQKKHKIETSHQSNYLNFELRNILVYRHSPI